MSNLNQLYDVFLYEKGTNKQVGKRRNKTAAEAVEIKKIFKDLDVKRQPVKVVIQPTPIIVPEEVMEDV